MVSCLMGDSTALASAIVRCCLIYIFTPEQEWKYCCPVSPDMRWWNVRNELAAESEIFNQNSEEQDCGENCDPVLSM